MLILAAAIIFVCYIVIDIVIEEKNTRKYKMDRQFDTIWVCDSPEMFVYIRKNSQGFDCEWLNNQRINMIDINFYPGTDSSVFIRNIYGNKEQLLEGDCRFRESECRIKRFL